MEVNVLDGDGLPHGTYVSIRAGEVRRQSPFKLGEVFKFDLRGAPKYCVIDVFHRIGTKQISIADLKDGTIGDRVEVLGWNGQKLGMQLAMNSDVVKPRAQCQHKIQGDAVNPKAKDYLDSNNIGSILQTMIHELLAEKPVNPLDFMLTYMSSLSDQEPTSQAQEQLPPKPPITFAKSEGSASASPSSTTASKTQAPTILPPRSDLEERPGSPSPPPAPPPPVTPVVEGCSIVRGDEAAALPELSGNHSILASVLTNTPAAYDACVARVTPLGVGLEPCIRPGLENPGAKWLRCAGVVAGDEYCYSVFKEIFDPVIEKVHECSLAGNVQLQDLDASKVGQADLGEHAVSVLIRGSRSLRGLRMPPAMSQEERLESERVLVAALAELTGDLQGEYTSLQPRTPSAANGLTLERECDFRDIDLMLRAPDAPSQISAGLDRDWPDARGVFANEDFTIAAWVNGMEHLQLTSRQEGANLREAFSRFSRADRAICAALNERGFDFSTHQQLGFLNSSLFNIGSALQVVMVLWLPVLSAHSDFRAVCKKLGVVVRRHTGHTLDSWEISNARRLGSSEVAQANKVLQAARVLVRLENEIKAVTELSVPARAESESIEDVAATSGDTIE